MLKKYCYIVSVYSILIYVLILYPTEYFFVFVNFIMLFVTASFIYGLSARAFSV